MKKEDRRTMAIRNELIDELIATSGGSLIGPDGLVKELTKAWWSGCFPVR